MFFFFKQKTAYEMRISDCSSDVCSSDLDLRACALVAAEGVRSRHEADTSRRRHGAEPVATCKHDRCGTKSLGATALGLPQMVLPQASPLPPLYRRLR